MQINNMNDAYFIKQNDTATEIHLQVTDSQGKPFGLDGKTVEVVIGNELGRFLTKIPTLLSAPGELTFGLDLGDAIPAGKQWLEIHIHEANGEKVVAPSKGYYQLRVERPIDELQVDVPLTTLDYLLLIIDEKSKQGPEGPQGIPGIQGPKGDKGDRGEKGDQGDKGDEGEPGTGINVLGSLPDVADLPPSSPTFGDGYLIGIHLWIWTPGGWIDGGPIKGPKGDKGEKGDQGIQGLRGIQGIQGEKGEKGEQGEQGPQGIQGLEGPKGDDIIMRQKKFIATDSQTVFNIGADFRYILLTVGGVPQYAPDNFTITSSTTFELVKGVPAGTLVYATYYTVIALNTSTDADLQDHIATEVSTQEAHGMRVTAGVFEYNNGTNWVPIQGGGSDEAVDITIEDVDGNFTSGNVEGALKESIEKANAAFLQANNGKTDIASVVGSPATSGDTFAQLKTHIQNVKSKGATNLTAKGVTASDTETLDSLMGKIASVPTGSSVKYAEGVSASSATQLTFQYSSSASHASMRSVTVPYADIGFIPTVIIIEAVASSTNASTIYKHGGAYYPHIANVTFHTTTTSNLYKFKGDASNAYVNGSGFQLPFGEGAYAVKWQAWG